MIKLILFSLAIIGLLVILITYYFNLFLDSFMPDGDEEDYENYQ